MELNWDNAKLWEEKANIKKEYGEPFWEWDCNFKLDFDGGIVSLSSRFYPPHYNDYDGWEGKVKIKVLGELIKEVEFKCDSLDELKIEVEKFTKHYSSIVKSKLK